MLDVEDVLYGRPRHWAQGRDDTTLIYGQTAVGRYLTVIITEAGDGGSFVVTARDMTDSEKRAYRRKSR